jgi:hypothetical protein
MGFFSILEREQKIQCLFKKSKQCFFFAWLKFSHITIWVHLVSLLSSLPSIL